MPATKSPDEMTTQELLDAFHDPDYEPRVHCLIRLRRERDTLYDNHWKAEDDRSIDRQWAMTTAADVYLADNWEGAWFEAGIHKARDFQSRQRESPDPWVQDLPIHHARVSPALIPFIEQHRDGWYREISRSRSLAKEVRQAGAHLIYRGLVQDNGALVSQRRHMVQDGTRLITHFLAGEPDHPLLQHLPLHYPGVKDGPDDVAVARERLEYIADMAEHYGAD